jgi:RHS repeat-associated protein
LGNEDDGGLMDFGARFYDPRIGRFMSPDPIKDASTSNASNPYVYCSNNPLRYTDKFGLSAMPDLRGTEDTGGDGGGGAGYTDIIMQNKLAEAEDWLNKKGGSLLNGLLSGGPSLPAQHAGTAQRAIVRAASGGALDPVLFIVTSTEGAARDEARRYYALLAGEYREENVTVRGLVDDIKDLDGAASETMSQEKLINTLKEITNEIITNDLNGGKLYDQIHIFGHGAHSDKGLGGMLFEQQIGGVPFDKGAAPAPPTEGQFPTVPVRKDGKAVIAACYSAEGGMVGWLQGHVDNVHGINTRLFSPRENPSGYIQPRWDAHPGLSSIKTFLDKK